MTAPDDIWAARRDLRGIDGNGEAKDIEPSPSPAISFDALKDGGIRQAVDRWLSLGECIFPGGQCHKTCGRLFPDYPAMEKDRMCPLTVYGKDKIAAALKSGLGRC